MEVDWDLGHVCGQKCLGGGGDELLVGIPLKAVPTVELGESEPQLVQVFSRRFLRPAKLEVRRESLMLVRAWIQLPVVRVGQESVFSAVRVGQWTRSVVVFLMMVVVERGTRRRVFDLLP